MVAAHGADRRWRRRHRHGRRADGDGCRTIGAGAVSRHHAVRIRRAVGEARVRVGRGGHGRDRRAAERAGRRPEHAVAGRARHGAPGQRHARVAGHGHQIRRRTDRKGRGGNEQDCEVRRTALYRSIEPDEDAHVGNGRAQTAATVLGELLQKRYRAETPVQAKGFARWECRAELFGNPKEIVVFAGSQIRYRVYQFSNLDSTPTRSLALLLAHDSRFHFRSRAGAGRERRPRTSCRAGSSVRWMPI